jgi:hypothetical protein
MGGVMGTGGAGGSGGVTNDLCATLQPGTRICVDTTHSGTCEWVQADLSPVEDRECPPTSVCQDGFCTAPQPVRGCARDHDCLGGTVCNLFMTINGRLAGFCAPPFPMTGGAMERCTAGSQCGTGFCANAPRADPRCLSLCVGNGDCGGGGQCKVFSLAGPVEGATPTQLKSCFSE